MFLLVSHDCSIQFLASKVKEKETKFPAELRENHRNVLKWDIGDINKN